MIFRGSVLNEFGAVCSHFCTPFSSFLSMVVGTGKTRRLGRKAALSQVEYECSLLGLQTVFI